MASPMELTKSPIDAPFETTGLSGYFEKKEKKKPTAAAPVSLAGATPISGSPTAAEAGARAPGGKSPTGFVGFERYFSANEPAVRAEAQRVVGQAAGPAGTSTMTMPSQPRVEFTPSLTGGQGTRMTQTSGRTVAKPTQMQLGEARAAKESVGTLAEPGGYQTAVEGSGQTKAQADFNAMLLGGVLPEQAKAEQARLGALESRLSEKAQADAARAVNYAASQASARGRADNDYYAKRDEEYAQQYTSGGSSGGYGERGVAKSTSNAREYTKAQREKGDTRSTAEIEAEFYQNNPYGVPK
jgi:hypothetical protein